MKYGLLPIMFIISTSFCFLSAETNTQMLLPSNNANQQSSVITLDVKPTVDQDAFFKSLIKDIDSDRVEYKDGKIFIYITPSETSIALKGCAAIFSTLFSALFIFLTLILFAEHDLIPFLVAIFTAGASLIFLEMVGIFSYVAYDDYQNRWFKKNPLITLDKDGIGYKNGRVISWNNIIDMIQTKLFIYDIFNGMRTNRTLTVTGPFGSEVFGISEDCSYSPITYDTMIELLNKAFYQVKQKQASASSPIQINEPSK